MRNSLTGYAKTKIRKIHKLSKAYNARNKTSHIERLLGLVGMHAAEIKDLYGKNDPHFLVETGDLAVLCFEIFREYGKSPDKMLDECYVRYDRKLTGLLRDLKPGRKRSK